MAVIRRTTRDNLDRHPEAAEVALVIEVSDTSLDRDLRLQKRIYAEAGIAVYWIVNLVERCVEVYSEPSPSQGEATYQSCRAYHLGMAIPLALAGQAEAMISVDELFP